MRTIYKFTIDLQKDSEINVTMSEGAELLFVACQQEHILSCWYQTVVDRPQILRRFVVYGTGQTHHLGGKYVGTALDGQFVWHLYEWSEE